MEVAQSGDAKIVVMSPSIRPMSVNTWKVDMFSQLELFATTAVPCVLIGRLCATMSTNIIGMKVNKTDSLRE